MGAAQQRAMPPPAGRRPKRRRRESLAQQEPSPPQAPPLLEQPGLPREWAYYVKNTRKKAFRLQLIQPRGGLAHLGSYIRQNGIRGVRAEIDSVPVLIQLFDELSNSCTSKRNAPPSNASVDLELLSITSYAPDGDPELKEALKRCLRACTSLRYLKLQFKSNSEVVAVACQNLPPAVHTLDLSDGFLPAESLSQHVAESFRIAIIRSDQLKDLNVYGTGVQAEAAGLDFYKCIESLGPFASSLRDIRGISFKSINQLPPRPPAHLTNSGGGSTATEWTVPRVLAYLRDRVFSQLFVERTMRVWWPPTDDPLKRDFAGRFWPAHILRVNPATLASLVRYDNGEQGYVSSREVFPNNPFEYGGGIRPYLLRSFSEETLTSVSTSVRNCLVELAQWELVAANPPPTRTRKDTRKAAAVAASDDANGIATFYETVNDPRNNSLREAVRTALNEIPKLLPLTAAQKEIADDHYASIALVERLLFQIPPHKIGSVLFPGEMCEFREGLGLIGDQSAITPDPSDFLVRVELVHEEEPMYTIRYIFHEDEDTLRVHSADIRRAVFTGWETWQENLFRQLKRLPQIQARYNIPLEHLRVEPVQQVQHSERAKKSARSKLLGSKQVGADAGSTYSTWSKLIPDEAALHQGGNNAFYLPKARSDLVSSSKDPPLLTPASLETTSTEHFAVWFLSQLRHHSHPALRASKKVTTTASLAKASSSRAFSGPSRQPSSSAAAPTAAETTIGSEVAALKAKVSFLAPFHQEALELREKFSEFSRQVEDLKRIVTCCICLDTPLATLLQPCGHLVACEKCSAKVTCCPTCRARIRQRLRVTNFSIDVYDTLQKFIATESM